MEKLQAFKQLISTPKRVVIVTHFKPDADALGSSLGLSAFLSKKGHSISVITPSNYPDFLAWMPGNETVLALSNEKPEVEQKALELIAAADMVFCLDFSNLSRINSLGDAIRKSNAIKVLIDHHLEPENFADYVQWSTASASTAGLIFELIEELGEKDLIDKTVATCLYAGLMTDTGSFKHNNTRHREFEIASELVYRGANPHEVAREIYDTNTLERLRLTGYVLSQKLVVLPDYNTAYMMLSQEELKSFGAQTGDTEGLVNYGLSIKDVKLSVLMYDRKEEIKLSFRSLGDFSVNAMARKYFEGGGHRNASGGSSKLSLEDTLKKFLSILPEYKTQLNKD
ncbi:MAG: bifunctional oligoribonuclease/PAP phosphatase NrnA [Cyclobacteriaceae bacterium]|nr:bifunctional oligoribonuclease/PAP phosphatase NrnA [Cyclobacteriaceae bacterium]